MVILWRNWISACLSLSIWFLTSVAAGQRPNLKPKTNPPLHRPSDHFWWLEILRLNYEYFSYSPIYMRGGEKFYVCINSLISAQMIIALSILHFLPQSSLSSFQQKLFINWQCKGIIVSNNFVNCSTKDANISEQFLDVKLWPLEKRELQMNFWWKGILEITWSNPRSK